MPESGGVRLAGEREYAFKHVLIRDVAYGMLPRAVRSRKHFQIGCYIEERAGERADEVVALLAEHFGRAASLGKEAGLEGAEVGLIHQKAVQYLESAGDAAASLYSNPEAYDHYDAVRRLEITEDPATVARVLEKQGDVAFRMGRVGTAVELWEECLEHHRQQEDLTRVADLHRKIGAGLWNRGERKLAIERYQKGINLLKDGPPCLELVHLYEEAAALYMHAGDNMLAIYASEKALRLAEKLEETRVASRAYGIFGRVFGRIGDKEKARENLESSVKLARDSDQGETIRALLTLGHHLEISEADYAGAGQAYGEALLLAQQVGDLPAQVELQSSIAQVASYRAAWDEVEEAAEASADLAEREGLVGKLCYPLVLRGVLAWRDGRWDDAQQWCTRAHELAEQVGWSEVSFAALYWLGRTLRDRGDNTAAITEIARALDVCERAGLIAQSIEATSLRAIMESMAGKADAARDDAEEAARLAERLHYPVGKAAALMAKGKTAEDPEEAIRMLTESRELWEAIGRPLDAAITDLLLGHTLAEQRPDEARVALDRAATEFERLGVAHLSDWAKAQSSSDADRSRSRRRRDPLGGAGRRPAGGDCQPVLQRGLGLRGPDRDCSPRSIAWSPTTRAAPVARRAGPRTRSRPMHGTWWASWRRRGAGGRGRDGRRLQPRGAFGCRAARPDRRRGVRRRQPGRCGRGGGHRRARRFRVCTGRVGLDDGDRLPRRDAHDDRHGQPRVRRGGGANARELDLRELPAGGRRRADAVVDRRQRAGAGKGARRPAVDTRVREGTRGSRSRSRAAPRALIPDAHIKEVEDGALSRPDITVDVVRAAHRRRGGRPGTRKGRADPRPFVTRRGLSRRRARATRRCG